MQELQLFIDVLNKHDFVQGHEVLEDKWKEWKKKPESKDESYILKGLINGATALALKCKKRDKGADMVWNTYLKYAPLIDTIPSPYTPAYKEAQNTLLKKYSEFFIQKSKI